MAKSLLSYAHDADVVCALRRDGPADVAYCCWCGTPRPGAGPTGTGDDRLRPLSAAGRKQAQQLAELLPLFGPDRVVSAPQVRCRDTVAPLADALGLPIADEPLLSEDPATPTTRTPR